MPTNYTKVDYEERPCVICATLFKPKTIKNCCCSKECSRQNQCRLASEWYYKNRDASLENRKQYVAEWRKLHPGETYMKCITSLYHGAKERAAKSGMDFSISPLDIVVPDICPVLNVKMQRPGRYAPSIDRKDAREGYTPDNIWVISKLANRMKNDATPDELRRFAEWAINQSKA